MRRWHRLKRNHKVELPQHMMFVDTEARIDQVDETTQRQYLRLGAACYVRMRNDRGNETTVERWHQFHEAEDFWRFVYSCVPVKGKLWVFCHNWNYDAGLLKVATIPQRDGWECVSYVNDNPPFMVKLRRGGATIFLVDSLNYFRSSLSALGEGIGFVKTLMPEFGEGDDQWFEYCRNDVEVLKAAVLAFRGFVSSEQLGNFQPTLASQAMVAYRHRFMPEEILIHGDEDICLLERDSYHGARTEAFFLGAKDERVYVLDINSMYPWIMRDFPFPRAFKSALPPIPVERLRVYEGHYALTIRCRIKTHEPVYPIRHEGRTVFPVGEFDTTLSTPEIAYALEHGHIMEVYGGAKYEQGYLFKDYVETLYTLRQRYASEGNKAFAYLCKILLNSLYGKFGQNGTKWADLHPDPDHPVEEWIEKETPDSPIVRYRIRLGMRQEFRREGETQNSFPAIAAHVTAYGRIYLWELIQIAGRHNVYYCDTDSLVVNQEGYEALELLRHNTELGKLKLERKAESFEIWGAKDYRIGKVEKHKGIKARAVQLRINQWEQDQFRSWDFGLGKHDDGYILVQKVQKTLHREYRKGIPRPDGLVDPLVADGTIWKMARCGKCGDYTQEWVESPTATYRRLKMTGWVGGIYVSHDKPRRQTGWKPQKLCLPCTYG